MPKYFEAPCLHINKYRKKLKLIPQDSMHIYSQKELLEVESVKLIGKNIEEIAKHEYRQPDFPNISNTLVCFEDNVDFTKNIFAIWEFEERLYLLIFEFRSAEMYCARGIYRTVYHMKYFYSMTGFMEKYFRGIGLSNLSVDVIHSSMKIFKDDFIYTLRTYS